MRKWSMVLIRLNRPAGADVDDTPALPAPVPGASGSLSQQVNDLRQQVATQTQMLQQVQTMQQQTQQLQGQLDDQQHAITQLQQQQLQQYQDLDSRLMALTQQVNGLKSSTGLVAPGPVGAASSATTAASVSPITPQPQAALAPAPSVNSAAVVTTKTSESCGCKINTAVAITTLSSGLQSNVGQAL